jgi:hypothetical protein
MELFDLFKRGPVFQLLLDGKQTAAAETVRIVGGNIPFVFVGQPDAVAFN